MASYYYFAIVYGCFITCPRSVVGPVWTARIQGQEMLGPGQAE